jgi:hypothetical protein
VICFIHLHRSNRQTWHFFPLLHPHHEIEYTVQLDIIPINMYCCQFGKAKWWLTFPRQIVVVVCSHNMIDLYFLCYILCLDSQTWKCKIPWRWKMSFPIKY